MHQGSVCRAELLGDEEPLGYDAGMDDASPENAPPPDDKSAPTETEPPPHPGWWERARPRLRQTRLNLRVWLGMPLPPAMRDCVVRYTARENRVGLEWDVELPVQCWRCAAQSGLRRKRIKRLVRAFGSAVPIAAGAAVLIAILFSLQCLVWVVFRESLLGIGALTLIVLALPLLAAAIIRLRSWRESVRVSIFACAEHADELPPPDAVVDDEQLHLILPTASLAEEAWAELRDARRRLARSLPDERDERAS